MFLMIGDIPAQITQTLTDFPEPSPPIIYRIEEKLGVRDDFLILYQPLWDCLSQLQIQPHDGLVFSQSLYPGFIEKECLPRLKHPKAPPFVGFCFPYPQAESEYTFGLYDPIPKRSWIRASLSLTGPIRHFATLPEAEAAYVMAVCQQFIHERWLHESTVYLEAIGMKKSQPVSKQTRMTNPPEVLYTFQSSKKQGKHLRLLAGGLAIGT